MRKSIVAAALALCLFGSLPARAVTVDLPGGLNFHVDGLIPEPLTVRATLSANFTFWDFTNRTRGDGYSVGVGSNILGEYVLDYFYSGYACCSAAQHSMLFTIPTDGDVHFSNYQVRIENGSGYLDAKLTFDLPDGLSVAAPVPEPSTWAMLLIGFAGIGFLTLRSRRFTSSSVPA